MSADEAIASEFLGHSPIVPFTALEITRNHLFRILDNLNPGAWVSTSTREISQEVILTLLQCAARSFEKPLLINEATNLIKSQDFQGILLLGIQDSLFQVARQQCIEGNKFSQTTESNSAESASLFSQTWHLEAMQSSSKGKLIVHLASLCSEHSTILQEPCGIAMPSETFIFKNYLTLVNLMGCTEKFHLTTLLPDMFQWQENANAITDATGYKPTDIVIINKELHRRITGHLTPDDASTQSIRKRLSTFSPAEFENEVLSVDLDRLLSIHKSTPDSAMAEKILEVALAIKTKGEKLLGLAHPGMPPEEVIKKLIDTATMEKGRREKVLKDRKLKEALLLSQIDALERGNREMSDVDVLEEVFPKVSFPRP